MTGGRLIILTAALIGCADAGLGPQKNGSFNSPVTPGKGSIAVICLGLYPSGVRSLEPGGVSRDVLSLAAPGRYRLRFPYRMQGRGAESVSALSNVFEVE